MGAVAALVGVVQRVCASSAISLGIGPGTALLLQQGVVAGDMVVVVVLVAVVAVAALVCASSATNLVTGQADAPMHEVHCLYGLLGVCLA
jgi:hypothetical protein